MSTRDPILAVYPQRATSEVVDRSKGQNADLESNVIVPDANLQLLLADDILLGPIRVVFSVWGMSRMRTCL